MSSNMDSTNAAAATATATTTDADGDVIPLQGNGDEESIGDAVLNALQGLAGSFAGSETSPAPETPATPEEQGNAEEAAPAPEVETNVQVAGATTEMSETPQSDPVEIDSTSQPGGDDTESQSRGATQDDSSSEVGPDASPGVVNQGTQQNNDRDPVEPVATELETDPSPNEVAGDTDRESESPTRQEAPPVRSSISETAADSPTNMLLILAPVPAAPTAPLSIPIPQTSAIHTYSGFPSHPDPPPDWLTLSNGLITATAVPSNLTSFLLQLEERELLPIQFDGNAAPEPASPEYTVVKSVSLNATQVVDETFQASERVVDRFSTEPLSFSPFVACENTEGEGRNFESVTVELNQETNAVRVRVDGKEKEQDFGECRVGVTAVDREGSLTTVGLLSITSVEGEGPPNIAGVSSTTALIVGATLGSVAILAVIVGLGWFFICFRRRRGGSRQGPKDSAVFDNATRLDASPLSSTPPTASTLNKNVSPFPSPSINQPIACGFPEEAPVALTSGQNQREGTGHVQSALSRPAPPSMASPRLDFNMGSVNRTEERNSWLQSPGTDSGQQTLGRGNVNDPNIHDDPSAPAAAIAHAVGSPFATPSVWPHNTPRHAGQSPRQQVTMSPVLVPAPSTTPVLDSDGVPVFHLTATASHNFSFNLPSDLVPPEPLRLKLPEDTPTWLTHSGAEFYGIPSAHDVRRTCVEVHVVKFGDCWLPKEGTFTRERAVEKKGTAARLVIDVGPS